VGIPGAHLEEPRSQSVISVSGDAVRFRPLTRVSGFLVRLIFEPTSDRRLPPLPAQPSCSALCLRFEPASVAIHRIPASGSSTVYSSGATSRLLSSLRLRSTVPPRLQLRRQLAPPTEPPVLLSCPPSGLRPGVEPSGLAIRSVVSLHRQLSFRFCCPAHRPTYAVRSAFRPQPSVVAVRFRFWLP